MSEKSYLLCGRVLRHTSTMDYYSSLKTSSIMMNTLAIAMRTPTAIVVRTPIRCYCYCRMDSYYSLYLQPLQSLR
ncbi:unnamed protein product, partial [Dovyalis caffra]